MAGIAVEKKGNDMWRRYYRLGQQRRVHSSFPLLMLQEIIAHQGSIAPKGLSGLHTGRQIGTEQIKGQIDGRIPTGHVILQIGKEPFVS